MKPKVRLIAPAGAAMRWGGLIVLLLLACPSTAQATVIGCEYILYPHLNFSFCFNHCRRSDTAVLRYAGVMEALNAHIERRIAEGRLEDKKFEIKFIDPIGDSGMPMTELSQNRRGYHITSRHDADLNLAHLVRIVDFFASESWRPFDCCYSIEHVTGEEQRKRLRRILDRSVGPPDLSRFAGRRSVVFEVGDLQVMYEDDRLSYWLAGQKLDLEPADPWPVRVANRYLLGSPESFHVYEDGVEIQKYPKKGMWKDMWTIKARANKKWANIGINRMSWLSYSSEQNRFYAIEIAVPEPALGGVSCGDERGSGELHPPALRVIVPP